MTFSIFWFNIIVSPIFHFPLFVQTTHLKKSCDPSTSFPPSLCLKKINEPYLMYNAAGERTAKKTLTLLNENLTTENATVDLRGRVGIIIPKSAMDWKTDVHLSVIYSTWPVRADKVSLACPPPFSLWITLLDTPGSRSGWMTSYVPDWNLATKLVYTWDCTIFALCVFVWWRLVSKGVSAEVHNYKPQNNG